ncbi:hypothetical protein B0H14DRAFT_2587133 [Mycena olivaceomarginata]|nr:hypothetical protein B0H14DRAFT_2587133 [Mycena olivaceomarginata]
MELTSEELGCSMGNMLRTCIMSHCHTTATSCITFLIEDNSRIIAPKRGAKFQPPTPARFQVPPFHTLDPSTPKRSLQSFGRTPVIHKEGDTEKRHNVTNRVRIKVEAEVPESDSWFQTCTLEQGGGRDTLGHRFRWSPPVDVKPTWPGRGAGIDWDEANNEFFGYIGLLNNGHLDLEEDEWVPCLKSSLTRLGNLLNKAILEAPESHKLNGQEVRIAGFRLHNLHVPYSTRSVKFTWWYALYCTKQAGLRRPLQGTCWDDSRGDPNLRQATDYHQRRKATNQVRDYYAAAPLSRKNSKRVPRRMLHGKTNQKLGLETSRMYTGATTPCSSAPRQARTQHIRVPDRKADHKRDGRMASGSVRSGVAMVRMHTMELVARYGARMRGSIWAGLTKGVSCAMGVSLQYIWARGKRHRLARSAALQVPPALFFVGVVPVGVGVVGVVTNDDERLFAMT